MEMTPPIPPRYVLRMECESGRWSIIDRRSGGYACSSGRALVDLKEDVAVLWLDLLRLWESIAPGARNVH
ncbi:hypothetical protein [Azospirillum sp. SYSU D00513]|uniref:hypothetical protein n=1 Tax=Azospirillum sp. SYSU D00513 TaxID=2812561 RepID=UPI001A9596AC|nr:hypothetical protein [Azospirillum sp. SYSU D00513]